MFMKKQVGLLAAMLASMAVCGTAVAAQADGALTVSATLTSACAVSAGSISFAAFSTLAPADQKADSATSFTVACSSDLAPKIFATGTRAVVSGVNSIPFNLSLTADAPADDLGTDISTAAALTTLTKDGTAYVVPLYARLVAANFKTKPAGDYTAALTVSVSY
jgi:spore coat protein U-like protein